MGLKIANTLMWWNDGIWNQTRILCQQMQFHDAAISVWAKGFNLQLSHTSIILFQLSLILVMTTLTSILFKPIRIPFVPQVLAGVLMGEIFKRPEFHLLFPPPVIYTLKTIEHLGFTLYYFMLGVQTNVHILKTIDKKSAIIGYGGYLTSVAFSHVIIRHSTLVSKSLKGGVTPESFIMLIYLNATSTFMSTCNHLNDLGIGNSQIGRLAASVSLILDIGGIILGIFIWDLILPIFSGEKSSILIVITISHYVALIFFWRPLIINIIKRTPEGMSMRQTHFVAICVIVLIVSLLGEITNQRLSTIIFAFILPEEPLTSILSEKVSVITSGVFFPIYCSVRGAQTNLRSIGRASSGLEVIICFSYLGKLAGTVAFSRLCGVPFLAALALGLILSSKGLMDISILNTWQMERRLEVHEYTAAVINILFFTGTFLPLVRYFYEPSSQYSTIRRQSVMESFKGDNFQVLACIYKEENVPGIIRILETLHPRANSLSVIALQLMQLIGSCSMPIMAPIHQLRSSSTFRSHLDRCNRIINAFLHFERGTNGHTRVQHYVAMASYVMMHNDIINLAYEKSTRLLIIPFHIHTIPDETMEESSLSIRGVNKAVLEKAPCSVGMLIDRGNGTLHRHVYDTNAFRMAILFIGGSDDHEALAYTSLFASNPNVVVNIIWLKGLQSGDEMDFDNEVITDCRAKYSDIEKISFQEVIVNDGAETIKFMVSMNDMVDLVVLGKYHDSKSAPVYGLDNGWTSYPELGLLGDILATSDFGFSVLVVQYEP